MAVLGVFVLVIAGMGGLSLCLYLTMINGLFHWWYLGAAAGWAFIVLTVDRSILAEPSYGDLRPVERRADHIASLGDQSLWPPSLAAEP
ncbi:hypothetical protein LV75_005125 [Actinokineospora diospyrosa]|uniref:Uncharacterized protein n=1 Tax=Actinokineospora diospyrosa TaxID=103728 RepID=A0ABT1IJ67_9PSEU|nr:hypothetical protein [Actinokineospora diospyrosa]